MLKRWFSEYKAGLKDLELEEPLDLFLYRPVAFLVVRLARPTFITANHLSLLSLASGLAAGLAFAWGRPGAYGGAVAWYFACNVFDCADGQLARIRGTKSLFGYLLDGTVDHFSTAAVFLGMGTSLAALTGRPGPSWALTLAGGLSMAWWCSIVDRKRLAWQYRVSGRRHDSGKELAGLEGQAARWSKEGSHHVTRMMIAFYGGYMRFWKKLQPPPPRARPTAAENRAWARAHYPVLRMAVWYGPTMHMTLIMAAALAGRLDLYFWFVLTAGNAWGLAVLALQSRADRGLVRVGAA